MNTNATNNTNTKISIIRLPAGRQVSFACPPAGGYISITFFTGEIKEYQVKIENKCLNNLIINKKIC